MGRLGEGGGVNYGNLGEGPGKEIFHETLILSLISIFMYPF